MRKIGSITLRGEHILWENSGEYVIEYVKEDKDRSFSEKIKVNIDDIDMAYELAKGKTLSRKEFENIMRENKDKFTFSKETYNSYKIIYRSQDLLICLVCLKKAIYRKEGREYLYTIL